MANVPEHSIISEPPIPIIAVDIGGTHLRAALFSPTMNAPALIPTMAHLGAESVLIRLKTLVDNLRATVRRPCAIAVATAGQVDPELGVIVDATDNLPGFRGLRLADRIQAWYPEAPAVLIENDVNAALAAEVALRPHDASFTLVVIALGTGVGGALGYRNQIIRGGHFFAGEVGHLILYPQGRPCNCGQAGCLEQYVSGPGILATAREFHPAVASTQEIFSAVLAEKAWAIKTIDRFCSDLAVGLTSLVNVLDPDLIVLAGGLAATHAVWADRLAVHLARVSRKTVPLAFTELGDHAGLTGAAWLVRERLMAPRPPAATDSGVSVGGG